MGRIQELFNNKKTKVLNVYCTAGYPAVDSILPVISSLQQCGVDLVEIGIPYSDPVADGPVIQQSNMQALNNGMSVKVLFGQLKDFRSSIHIPVILMGYLNPVMQYGFEQFCNEAAALGVDGLIIPDLPLYAFEKEYGFIIKNAGLDFIFLVTPETNPERIRLLDSMGSGFLYAVTSSSTTGSERNKTGVADYLQRLSQMKLKNPILAGFGIKDHDGFEMVCQYVPGAIVGSAYINRLKHATGIHAATEPFIRLLRTGK